MEKHINLLAILYIVYGAIHLLGGLVGWFLLRWSGFYHQVVAGRLAEFAMLASGIVAVLLLFLVVASAAGIIGAIGLLNRKRWARILLLVLSFLNLIHFPLGTALGVYGIWVLMKDETDALFPPTSAPVPEQQGTGGH